MNFKGLTLIGVVAALSKAALVPLGLAAVSENALPPAQWISVTPTADSGQSAFFRRVFTAPPALVKTVLLTASDERMAVFVNGQSVAEIGGYERAASIDVTPHVREGVNVIAVRVDHSDGLAAFRLMLELATERGRQSWISSDATWLCSLAEADGWKEVGFGANWTAAFSHGPAGLQRWGDAFNATKSVDAYNSWMLASGVAQATDPATINVPKGYRVELLRSAQADEGSWVALAFDPKGRIIIAREQRGLLRMTLGPRAVENVEVIDDTLLECRGILYAYDSLYANANNSKGLYRLRDTDGDDKFDESKLLLSVGGGVGHGRNHLRLGPDGLIYIAQGNDVELPANIAADSPLRHWATDQLFPLRWGEHGTTKGIVPPHGHILQTDREGSFWRVIAGGLRNQLDVDFNEDGEMFTYDADNERDIGTPWYRPTRVLHITSGAEYGWRIGAGKLPVYLPDTLPAAVDIGVGSPCGVEFGTRSRFPLKYRRALYIADWAYGRIIAAHLQSNGSSYGGTSEPFVTGRPLNVTDIVFGPDGAMYFTTGGRRTQSGLYRVSYTGTPDEDTALERKDTSHAEMRELRRKLEALHGRTVPGAIEFALPHLSHPDRFIRYAARVAIEAQPLDGWQERALAEQEPVKAISALLAIVRVGPPGLQAPSLSRLLQFPLDSLSEQQRLDAVRVCQVSCTRMGRPDAETSSAVRAYCEQIYPARSPALNHELCRLLIYLGSSEALPKTIALISDARTSEDLLHYLWHIRHIKEGWTAEQRRIALQALNRAEQLQGAREYFQALRDIRRDLIDALPEPDRALLADVNANAVTSAASLPQIDWANYAYRQSWKVSDFSAADLARNGNPGIGRETYFVAQCIQCHRFGDDAGRGLGPDLSSVASRFGRRDLLLHMLEPSAAIDDKYRNSVIKLRNGTVYAGIVQEESDTGVRLSTGSTPDDVVTLDAAQIESKEPSPTSPMPAGLLNILTKEQIVDLIAYLEAGGDRRELHDPDR